MSTVIQVENLSKKYILDHQKQELHSALRDVVSYGIKNLWNRLLDSFKPSTLQPFNRSSKVDFWALKDISFEIKQGDQVGIIGRNGAGKSTLLKILSRITKPTSGKIGMKGRVSSLLEVGTGFHPELTGRENIYLNGAILGMSKNHIKNKFDEIVDFADIEKFIDTPVKHYSSGMYVRLAFAVAAHLEPEILIVDEVLAVGDAQFQKKSLGKMKEVGKEGRTVLFVSHDMQAISTLTQRCIVLSQGECLYLGSTEKSIDKYLSINENQELIFTAHPSQEIPRVTRVEIHTSEPGNVQKNGKPLDISIEISTPYSLEKGAVSFQILDRYRRPVIHLWIADSELLFGKKKGVHNLFCHIPNLRLYMGQYTIVVRFSECFGRKNSQTIENICPFEVVMYGQHRDFSWYPDACSYIEDCTWTVV